MFILICIFSRFILTLSFTPYQTFIFLEILFKIRNQQKILKKKVKILFFVKTPKNSFSDPQTTNPNKNPETFLIVMTPKNPH